MQASTMMVREIGVTSKGLQGFNPRRADCIVWRVRTGSIPALWRASGMQRSGGLRPGHEAS